MSIVTERHDNHREAMYRFTVRAIVDLESRTVPFFEQKPIDHGKVVRFQKFATVVAMLRCRTHLTEGWFGADSSDISDDEPETAVAVSGILRGHTPATS
jgi:hypothetical protein